MTSWRHQRGEGKIGTIFWLVVFAFGGYFSYQMIPMKIADVQLRDHMDELAKLYPRGTEEFFEKEILVRAGQLRIPLDKKNVVVKKDGQLRVFMQVDYEREVNLLVTKITWKFSHDMERDLFLM